MCTNILQDHYNNSFCKRFCKRFLSKLKKCGIKTSGKLEAPKENFLHNFAFCLNCDNILLNSEKLATFSLNNSSCVNLLLRTHGNGNSVENDSIFRLFHRTILVCLKTTCLNLLVKSFCESCV